jgi:hypothetical protein
MAPHIKKFALALVMLVMPLQGVAATLSALLCHGGGTARIVHSPNDAEGATQHGGPLDEGGMSGSVADHPCCNHFVSASPVAKLPSALPDFQVRAYAPDPLHDLFVPERPHRPPLA